MAVEYAPRGLFGVLTPQANTTVEPELAIMTPVGYGWINGRLTSGRPTIEQRLVDYYEALGGSLIQFANAPIKAVAIACTGASYLCGSAREDAFVEEWGALAGVPVITAARAVVAALHVIGAKRIGLVSPYPASLDTASEAYWSSRGFTVAARATAFRESAEFHPIYSLSSSASQHAVEELKTTDVDAIVMLGTGMPTLAAILRANVESGPPVISCMLAMAWITITAVDGGVSRSDDLAAWLRGASWGCKNRLPP